MYININHWNLFWTIRIKSTRPYATFNVNIDIVLKSNLRTLKWIILYGVPIKILQRISRLSHAFYTSRPWSPSLIWSQSYRFDFWNITVDFCSATNFTAYSSFSEANGCSVGYFLHFMEALVPYSFREIPPFIPNLRQMISLHATMPLLWGIY